MRIWKIAALPFLALATVGCDDSSPGEFSKKPHKTPEWATRKFEDPLIRYRKLIPGIQLFDENKDNILSEEEVERFVLVTIAEGKKEPLTQRQVDQIVKVRNLLIESSVKNKNGFSSLTMNETIHNFDMAIKKHRKIAYDLRDLEVKQKKERILKQN